jgi:hypothetical protein
MFRNVSPVDGESAQVCANCVKCVSSNSTYRKAESEAIAVKAQVFVFHQCHFSRILDILGRVLEGFLLYPLM